MPIDPVRDCWMH